MGKVTTVATIENFGDVWNATQGLVAPEAVRRVEVPDALVDTGASLLSLPTTLIQQLGLVCRQTRQVIGSAGPRTTRLFSAVQLTIQDRSCVVDVLEVPDGVPTLIGQIPLENLDFVVDLSGQRLIGNPAHGGEHVLELY
jgi:predicted aspartyl protease